jgi:hypothetical protein
VPWLLAWRTLRGSCGASAASRCGSRSARDGLAGQEGTFLLCTFWLAQAQALAGDIEAATATFDRAVAAINDVGLLAEEVDPRSGEMIGNYPQAFSHMGLIKAAWAISQAQQSCAGKRRCLAGSSRVSRRSSGRRLMTVVLGQDVYDMSGSYRPRDPNGCRLDCPAIRPQLLDLRLLKSRKHRNVEAEALALWT